MKLIAHRGGSFGKENSLDTMIGAARMGADMVECDIRKTADGVYVIYHDNDLSRLAGVQATVDGVTYEQMQELLAKKNEKVITFEELVANYRESTPILLHIKLTDYDEVFTKYIVDSGLPLVPGVMSLDMLKCFAAHLPPERILAFLPSEKDAEAFYQNGAGILRLWEQWLCDERINAVLSSGKGLWIMANNPELGFGYSSPALLKQWKDMGVDGVLINDISPAKEI